MLFSSHEFLFVFLPLTVLLYAIVRKSRSQTATTVVLVLASAIFYAYFRIDYAVLLFASISANYFIGIRLQRAPQKSLLIAGIVANVALLGYFKYYDFFVSQIIAVAGADIPFLRLVLPLGISFHTFQQIAYLVDCHQGRLSDYNFLRYILFVTFLPQLIAGPIVHHAEMMPQFAKRNDRFIENLALGLTIFFIGLFKKTVIADSLDVYSSGFDKVAQGYPITLIEAWSTVLAYTLQIYFDFSAYSDMAIGLARIFGIVMPVNFLSPYKAVNVADFWRRWHISLSRWLRNYIYIPLGGNRKGHLRRYTNLMLTMLIGGLWHGAGWTFVLWGGLHGFYLIVHHGWQNIAGDRIRIPRPIAIGMTFFAVLITWVPFRAPNLASALTMYEAMIGLKGFALPADYAPRLAAIQGVLDKFGVQYVNRDLLFEGTSQVIHFGVLLAFVWFLPNVVDIFQRTGPALLPEGYRPVRVAWPWQQRVRWAVAAGAIAIFAVAGIGRSIEFIYFQF
jgi:alginate O-acetyltransferase complex protein AlgI